MITIFNFFKSKILISKIKNFFNISNIITDWLRWNYYMLIKKCIDANIDFVHIGRVENQGYVILLYLKLNN